MKIENYRNHDLNEQFKKVDEIFKSIFTNF